MIFDGRLPYPVKIYRVSFSEKTAQAALDGLGSQPKVVTELATYAGNPELLSGVSMLKNGNEVSYSVFLGKLPGVNTTPSSVFSSADICRLSDRPIGLQLRSSNQIAVATPGAVSVYQIDTNQAAEPMTKLPVVNCTAMIADGSSESPLAFASDRSLCLWDTRSNQLSLNMKTSHFFPILALDVNPNLDFVYVTGGSDGKIMFWDIRQANGANPLEVISNAHAHHVTSVRYHPVHDQLLISSGTDCAVNLWRCQKAGSSKQLPAVSDGLIESYRHHEDSVYRCCWSREGWAFASVSHDGLVMVNTVPTSEKYRIMV